MELETYDHIPALNEILRGNGLPGYVYHYISTANQGLATQQGLKPTDKNQPFRVEGPKGFADVLLMVMGDHIQGASPAASKQDVLVDTTIYEDSGILTPDELDELTANAAKPNPTGGVTIQGDGSGPIETPADAAARVEGEKTRKRGKPTA
tara:strand:- start:6517 stop:6969 length:453 start_codon:yes stop_codon:yes gene_type:complete